MADLIDLEEERRLAVDYVAQTDVSDVQSLLSQTNRGRALLLMYNDLLPS